MKQAKPNILVADVLKGQDRARSALGADFSLQFVDTLSEAEKILLDKDPSFFQLVVVGIHFDESRAFELVNFIRRAGSLSNVPILAVQTLQFEMADVSEQAAQCLYLLGACNYVRTVDLPATEADAVLRRHAMACVDKPVGELRRDHKTDQA